MFKRVKHQHRISFQHTDMLGAETQPFITLYTNNHTFKGDLTAIVKFLQRVLQVCIAFIGSIKRKLQPSRFEDSSSFPVMALLYNAK